MPRLDRYTLEAMAAVGLGAIEQTVAFGDFTDIAATGFIDLDQLLPPGAVVLACSCKVTTGFTGDTSAAVQIGISGQTAQFSADTAQSVLVSDTFVAFASIAASSGDSAGAGVAIRVTVTGNADFTSISAGEMDVRIVYVNMR